MKLNLKKIAVSLLACWILLISCGVVVTAHTCYNNGITSISINKYFHRSKKSCCDNHEKTSTSFSCCKYSVSFNKFEAKVSHISSNASESDGHFQLLVHSLTDCFIRCTSIDNFGYLSHFYLPRFNLQQYLSLLQSFRL